MSCSAPSVSGRRSEDKYGGGVKQDSSAADGPFSPAGLKVLVVDDDPMCLKVVSAMLKRCHYEVETRQNGLEALALLRERQDEDQQFDLVLSDVYMPDIDGFKLLEHIGLELDIPVIMMSSNGDTTVVLRGVTHGAVDFLIKPVRVEELRNVWQHVVRRRSLAISRAGDDNSVDCEAEGSRHGTKRKDNEVLRAEHETGSGNKKQRVIWTQEMHQQFVAAVNQLGIDKAFPKRILDLMRVEGLTRENVASHLQKYRLYLKRMEGHATANGGGGMVSNVTGMLGGSKGMTASAGGGNGDNQMPGLATGSPAMGLGVDDGDGSNMLHSYSQRVGSRATTTIPRNNSQGSRGGGFSAQQHQQHQQQPGGMDMGGYGQPTTTGPSSAAAAHGSQTGAGGLASANGYQQQQQQQQQAQQQQAQQQAMMGMANLAAWQQQTMAMQAAAAAAASGINASGMSYMGGHPMSSPMMPPSFANMGAPGMPAYPPTAAAAAAAAAHQQRSSGMDMNAMMMAGYQHAAAAAAAQAQAQAAVHAMRYSTPTAAPPPPPAAAGPSSANAGAGGYSAHHSHHHHHTHQPGSQLPNSHSLPSFASHGTLLPGSNANGNGNGNGHHSGTSTTASKPGHNGGGGGGGLFGDVGGPPSHNPLTTDNTTPHVDASGFPSSLTGVGVGVGSADDSLLPSLVDGLVGVGGGEHLEDPLGLNPPRKSEGVDAFLDMFLDNNADGHHGPH